MGAEIEVGPVKILRSFGGGRGEWFVVPQDAHLRDDGTVAKMGAKL
jgi:hypothetical protein